MTTTTAMLVIRLPVLLGDVDGVLVGDVLGEPPLLVGDRDVVAAHLALAHQTVLGERPVLRRGRCQQQVYT